MKKTKEFIEKKWEQKFKALKDKAEYNLKLRQQDYRAKAEVDIDKKLEKYRKKTASYLARKKVEYDRKCKNEIRQSEWKEVKTYKLKSKTRNQLLQFALSIAQENAKLRDTDKQGNWVCISCNKKTSWSNWHGWHLFSRMLQWVALRKENINFQCRDCNYTTWPKWSTVMKEITNQVYKKNLIRKYGLDRYLELEEHMQKWFANIDKYSPSYTFLESYIPDLIEENEKLRKTKSFYKPWKNRRKQWESFVLKNPIKW